MQIPNKQFNSNQTQVFQTRKIQEPVRVPKANLALLMQYVRISDNVKVPVMRNNISAKYGMPNTYEHCKLCKAFETCVIGKQMHKDFSESEARLDGLGNWAGEQSGSVIATHAPIYPVYNPSIETLNAPSHEHQQQVLSTVWIRADHRFIHPEAGIEMQAYINLNIPVVHKTAMGEYPTRMPSDEEAKASLTQDAQWQIQYNAKIQRGINFLTYTEEPETPIVPRNKAKVKMIFKGRVKRHSTTNLCKACAHLGFNCRGKRDGVVNS